MVALNNWFGVIPDFVPLAISFFLHIFYSFPPQFVQNFFPTSQTAPHAPHSNSSAAAGASSFAPQSLQNFRVASFTNPQAQTIPFTIGCACACGWGGGSCWGCGDAGSGWGMVSSFPHEPQNLILPSFIVPQAWHATLFCASAPCFAWLPSLSITPLATSPPTAMPNPNPRPRPTELNIHVLLSSDKKHITTKRVSYFLRKNNNFS
jgi:hypothetical protein